MFKSKLIDIYDKLEVYSFECTRYASIISRLLMMDAIDLSEKELERVFGDCVAPKTCKKIALELGTKYDI